MKVFLSHTRASLDVQQIETLRTNLLAYGYQVAPMSDRASGDTCDFEREIRNSDVLIALLSEQSPDVLLELGYAMGADKQVYLVSPAHVPIPGQLSDVKSVRRELSDPDLIFEILLLLEHDPSSRAREGGSLLSWTARHRHTRRLLDSRTIDWSEIEEALMQWFSDQGYSVEKSSLESDLGFDFLVHGYEGTRKTIVECKQYSHNRKVPSGSVQHILTALHANGADRAILVTTSDFTRSALGLAEHFQPKVSLWKYTEDGVVPAVQSTLTEGYDVGPTDSARQRIQRSGVEEFRNDR